jgi:DNA polymerase-3 subunit delta
VLAQLAERRTPDVVLLVVLGKLETRQRGAAWLEALDRAGVSIATRPVSPASLPGWITTRARRSSLELSEDAARLLAERTEGNLLACHQEIEKLALLYPGERVGLTQVLASSGDSARYDVFTLVDTALAGDPRRSARVLDGLRGEGLEPPLVVWALARELRTLASMARRLRLGEPLARLLGRYRVWEARKPAVQRALERHTPGTLSSFLRRLADIDRIAKGLAPGDPWLELSRLVLTIAGVRFPAGTRPH